MTAAVLKEPEGAGSWSRAAGTRVTVLLFRESFVLSFSYASSLEVNASNHSGPCYLKDKEEGLD